MQAGDTDGFLLIGALICGLMAIVSVLRYKTRGTSAYIMSAAFVVLGGTMLLDRMHAPMPFLIGGCVLLVVLLIVDFAVRSARDAGKEPLP